ncbi:L-2,4-diaminobutyrate decarboxylase [Roseovarius litorisediminis]|uniref:L-2,4-diaminobutyrate decarboxylase n=1 Tax=Roseovarius litorisediminis TaxID=1312363 RepID=A0A1Y5TRJ8_9RHOB|nr:pyridoxal-dependent decarboxylase [Roseovarius litorisediminis]SLN69856.1 L-2,4-diaminobutyrate decarboxylase [Roseovarius litorisediminis]
MKHAHAFPAVTGPLATASAYATGYRDSKKHLHPTANLDDLRNAFGGDLPAKGQPGEQVIADLIHAAEPGLVGNTQPGFLAWVMGSSHTTGVAADWLTSIWGQNAAIYQCSPAAATAEEVACDWVLDILDLPRKASVGITTGATMASFIGLAAARDEVLRRAGHDFSQDGLQGTPRITIFISDDTHVSNLAALRYLGLGNRNIERIPTDDQGRLVIRALADRMALFRGPKIMVATAGHINSGAFDDFHALADLAIQHDAWLHIDAAFGLWARASLSTRAMTTGIDRADSWSTDGHKWLQIPFDSGFAIVKDKDAHRRAMDISASYLSEAPGDGRNATHFNPELSRRARGFTVWATLKALGRDGISDMVHNHCNCASLLAYKLEGTPGIIIHNDVVLNQLVLSFDRGRGAEDTDQMTQAMEAALNADGQHFFRTAVWQGRKVLRVSIISVDTGPLDIQLLARKMKDLWKDICG